MQTAANAAAQPIELHWIDVHRVKRKARFQGEVDTVLIFLEGETTQVRKIVAVDDNLDTDAETKAILNCIAHMSFFGDW